jgi:NAD(P)-dependent dehydrogenase (short-subunit alcohol dehydrogenase family)
MQLVGETAVVTGAASGIGRALARRLAQAGARLVLADIDGPALTATASEVGATAVVTDVASPDDNEALADVAGPTRVLCLNAGVTGSHLGPVWLTPPDQWARVMGVNLGGVVNGLRAFVPRMLSDDQPHHILITASLAGLATWPGGGAYAASKHAVVTVAEQAALELSDSRVTVTVSCPALVRSGMSTEGAEPDGVAVEALDATGRGQFTVIPAEWRQAVRDRGMRLAAGERPRLPAATPPAVGERSR